MKRFWIALLVTLLVLGSIGIAMAGNEYIPGSIDLDSSAWLGRDGKSWQNVHMGNQITFEGTTSDANEATIVVPDPASDITYTFPAASGTLMTTGSAGSLTDSTDKNILISNGVLFQSTTLTGKLSITNSGITNLPDASGGNILVSDGTNFTSVTASGDVTIASGGAVTIGNNKIGVAEFNVNTVTIDLWSAQTSNTATVTSGSAILGYYPFANIDDIGAESANIVSISGTTLTLTLNGPVAGDTILYKVVVLEP